MQKQKKVAFYINITPASRANRPTTNYTLNLKTVDVNNPVTPFLTSLSTAPIRCAIFMSGSGTNAEVLLRRAEAPGTSYRPCVIVTDAPETSRARELARHFNLPLVESDIREFYRSNGEDSIRLDTPRRRELRNRWSDRLETALRPYEVQFIVLAGFVPLTNLADRIPCLNVHPGDLTAEDTTGRRCYAGLHFKPVEQAILAGEKTLRSSVILAQPYSGSGRDDMDSGPILGISAPVPIDLQGTPVTELEAIFQSRTAPPYRDRLRELASLNLERLKIAGDHVVFPEAVADFAAGNFGHNRQGGLFFRLDGTWRPIRTVEYCRDGSRKLRSAD